MNPTQLQHYLNKLNFETDSWDLAESLKAGQNIIVIDARSPQAHQHEHIPDADFSTARLAADRRRHVRARRTSDQ